jgi:ParB family chromosome partitioning protein
MAEKRTGLGRGIGALIPTSGETIPDRGVDVFFPASGTTTADATGARLLSIDPNSVVPNPQQPRSEFRPEDLAELEHSIREFGVLQPIVVRPLDGEGRNARYELVMGERRLRASKDADMLRDALLENLHRANLNPLEEASAYQQLLSDFGITQDELAKRIGRSRPQVTNTLRLLKLPIAVQQRVAAGVLSAGHARAILSLPDEEDRVRLATKIVNEDLSVRVAEQVASEMPGRKGNTKPKPKAGTKTAHFDVIAEKLGDKLNTRVGISLGKTRGIITIEFATIADLNRIAKELGVSVND